MDSKLTEEEFVTKALDALKKPPYKGIHTVYSGFNKAFIEYFSKAPKDTVMRMEAEGKLETRPAKGGFMLYKPGEGPGQTSVREALGKILG